MQNEQRKTQARRGTPVSAAEAAYVTELTRKTIDQAIDRNEVRPLPSRGGADSARSLGYSELVYLRMRREVAGTLSASARRALYAELRRSLPQNPRLSNVELGSVSVNTAGAVEAVRRRLAQLRRARRHVVTDPAIRGSEPVVRGTRVPVHMLAELAAQGAPREELLEDYPGVSPDALDAALLYACLHPRRGPRKRAPWHAAAPARP